MSVVSAGKYPHSVKRPVARCRALSTLLCGGVLAALGGCHADAAPVPEPTLTTPGAFIAAPLDAVSAPEGAAGAAGSAGGAADDTNEPERYRLMRVLQVLRTVNDQAVYYFDYGVKDSLQEARDAARARENGEPTTNYLVASLHRLESTGAIVVWFRSLTQEEQDVLR